jgi:hypothetical protein
MKPMVKQAAEKGADYLVANTAGRFLPTDLARHWSATLSPTPPVSYPDHPTEYTCRDPRLRDIKGIVVINGWHGDVVVLNRDGVADTIHVPSR